MDFVKISFYIKSLQLSYAQYAFEKRILNDSSYILCTISLANSYVSHGFVLIFVHYQTISIAMTKEDLGKMKPRIYRRHPLNRYLGRKRIAGGASKQNSHPL